MVTSSADSSVFMSKTVHSLTSEFCMCAKIIQVRKTKNYMVKILTVAQQIGRL
jgi:hypothetical protein